MTATAPSRRQRDIELPEATDLTYPLSEVANTPDAAWFANNPSRNYRAREATSAEIFTVQTLEHRLLEVEAGCGAIALICRTAKCRRRVVIEGCEFTLETMTDAEIGRVFAQVSANGWTIIEWRPS